MEIGGLVVHATLEKNLTLLCSTDRQLTLEKALLDALLDGVAVPHLPALGKTCWPHASSLIDVQASVGVLENAQKASMHQLATPLCKPYIDVLHTSVLGMAQGKPPKL